MSLSAALARLPRTGAAGTAATVCGSTVVGGLLAGTIYLTEASSFWIAFLGGVLLAAMLALVSRASRAEWVVARRSRQLQRERARAEEALRRAAAATEAYRTVETRLEVLQDALPVPVLLADRDGVCRYHTRAAARTFGREGDAVDGLSLRELLGDEHYAGIEAHLDATWRGGRVAYELGIGGAEYFVRHMPFPDAGPVQGACIVLTPKAMVGHAAGEPAALQVAGEHGHTLYLREMARQLTGWDEPREKLERALEEDRFVLYAQEIRPVDLGVQPAPCWEILLRLQEEEDHLLPPGGFLAEAERYGMMEQLDRWVVRNLVTRCLERERAEPGWRAPVFFVNLSSAAIASAEFPAYVQRQVKRGRFDARSLCFEIAEGELLALPAQTRRLVSMLRPFGCRFAIDGFGSVKGTFAALHGLPVDFIKIDGVIVQNVLRDPTARARASAIAAVCRQTGRKSIAEFVEDADTFNALRRIGVDYVQGFGIARPGPLELARAPALATE